MTAKNTINNYYINELKEKKAHIQNDAIKQLLREKKDAEALVKLIAPEYMGVYIVDRETDYFRDIIGPGYFRKIVKKSYGCYTDALKMYRDQYVLEVDRDNFSRLWDYDSIYETLKSGEEVYFSYRKTDGVHVGLRIHSYSEREDDSNLSVWIYTNEKLKDELYEARDDNQLKNEILSAIGKTYYYISRIDLEADRYEVVTGAENFSGNVKLEDCFSKTLLHNCGRLVAPAYLADFLKFVDPSTMADRLKDDESISMEYRLLNGNWHKARLIVKKKNEQGRVTHVLCAVRNISDEKRREKQLAMEAAEARHEVIEKTRFLSNMSHDIRTPMNGIIGMIDIAEQYPDDYKVQEKCRKKIKELSGYLVSIINDVLDMNKLQSDDFVIQDMPFDITDMLRTANKDAQIKAEKKEIKYEIDWKKSRISHRYLVGNPMYAARILAILADNAIKFSTVGSSISVWCTEKMIDDETTGFTFYCQDNGCGMSKEFVKRAFALFSQEDEGSRTRYQGVGLGLSIAKGLTDRLHGTIRLESEKGVGTTAIVEIPFKICSSENIETVRDYSNIELNGLRVLVVEDNELNMEIARFILEEIGLKVEGASDGMEAVEMYEKSEPGYYDVILMDIMMPRLNGLDATRKIRMCKRKDAGEIPIIAMSANTFAEDRIKSRLAGMDAHLAKPLDKKEIAEVLKKCLSKRFLGVNC